MVEDFYLLKLVISVNGFVFKTFHSCLAFLYTIISPIKVSHLHSYSLSIKKEKISTHSFNSLLKKIFILCLILNDFAYKFHLCQIRKKE
jgi:hypothetical protein